MFCSVERGVCPNKMYIFKTTRSSNYSIASSHVVYYTIIYSLILQRSVVCYRGKKNITAMLYCIYSKTITALSEKNKKQKQNLHN